MTTSLLSAQCSDGIRHVILNARSDTVKRFDLQNLKPGYVNG